MLYYPEASWKLNLLFYIDLELGKEEILFQKIIGEFISDVVLQKAKISEESTVIESKEI